MIGKNILEEKIISQAEAREILEKVCNEREEPVYEQRITLDFLRKFVKIDKESAIKAINELIESNEKIRIKTAIKLIDLFPMDEDGVRAIFAKERFTLSSEEIKEILNILDKYRPK